MSVMLVRLSDCEFFYIYIFDLVFGYNPFIWKILLGKLCFSLFPLFSPATVGGWWCKGVVGGLGLICTHAFATRCVSVCAFQTRGWVHGVYPLHVAWELYRVLLVTTFDYLLSPMGKMRDKDFG